MSTNVKVHYQGFLEGHNGWVTSLQVGQTKEGKPLLISGSRDKSIIVWKLDLENPEEIKNEKVTPNGRPALVNPINNGMDEQEQKGVTVPNSAAIIFAQIPRNCPKIRLLRSGGKKL